MVQLRHTGTLRIPPLSISCDNQAVVSQVNGNWCGKAPSEERSRIQESLRTLTATLGVKPLDGHFFHYVPRELNRKADALANQALDYGPSQVWHKPAIAELLKVIASSRPGVYVQGRFDGAFRQGSQRGAVGGCLEVWIGNVAEDLLTFGLEVTCADSYQAEILAAGFLTEHSVQLFTKIFLATCP